MLQYYEYYSLLSAALTEPEFAKYADSIKPYNSGGEACITQRFVRYMDNTLAVTQEYFSFFRNKPFDVPELVTVHNSICRGLFDDSMQIYLGADDYKELQFDNVSNCVDVAAKAFKYNLFQHGYTASILTLVNPWLLRKKELMLVIRTKYISEFYESVKQCVEFGNHYKIRSFLLDKCLYKSELLKKQEI